MKYSETRELYEEFHKDTSFSRSIPQMTDFTLINHLPIYRKYISPGQDILDIGCGAGPFSLYAASVGARVKGIDLSARAIAADRKSAEYLGLPDLEFVNEDFMTYMDAEVYDVIMLTEVLEHLPDDGKALEKIRSLLKKNGVLLMSVPSVNAPLHIRYVDKYGKDPFDERVGHLRRYDAVTIFNLLHSTGYSLIEFKLCEGYLRNWLFNDSFGHSLMRFNRSFVRRIVSFIDDKFFVPLWGESDIVIAAQKL